MSSQTPAFELLRSPSPDQTTLSQHFPRIVKKAVANPYKKVSKHHGKNTMNTEIAHNPQSNQKIPTRNLRTPSDWHEQPPPTKPSPTNSPQTSKFGNIHIREVSRPDVISRYFQDSNCVDVHNQLRQYALRLEKKWVTTNPYFRLHTTLTGINVVDTFQLASFHGIIGREQRLYADYDDDDDEKNVTAIQRFGGILAKQLVLKAQGLNERRSELFRARMNCLGAGMGDFTSSQESNELDEEDGDEVGISAAVDEDVSTISGIGGCEGNENSDNDDEESIIKCGRSVKSGDINNKQKMNKSVLLHSMVDRMGCTHQAVKNQWKVQKNGDRVGKGYTPAYYCCMDGCRKKSRVHCYQCNKVFCFSLVNDKESSMDGSTGMLTGDSASCFVKHVNQVRRKSRR